MRMLGVVWIVKFVVLAEVHLLEDAALHEQRQRAIDSGARHGRIDLARHGEQLLGGVMLRRAEGRARQGVTMIVDPAVRRMSTKRVGRAGLEPAANGLKVRCSTIELPTPVAAAP